MVDAKEHGGSDKNYGQASHTAIVSLGERPCKGNRPKRALRNNIIFAFLPQSRALC